MRGDDKLQDGMGSYISAEKRVPEDHPLGPIRCMVNGVLMFLRFIFRITSFRSDQTSSTAQTLISTSPRGSAAALISSPETSVGSPEDFLGQDTHMDPFW